MSSTGRIHLLLVAFAALFAAVVGSRAAASPQFAPYDLLAPAETGTLNFETELSLRYPPTACPAGTPGSVACFARAGSGIVRGLGKAEESSLYLLEEFPTGCDAGQVRILPTTARLRLAGKGEIELRLGGTGCLTRTPPDPVRGEETFTITGGSGRYAGASGGGTLAHVSNGPPTWHGMDTWTGTLVVHGLDFDLTPPTLSGAGSKTVRAPRGVKRVRVNYAVTARDGVDGAVRVNCRPRSGSWFSIGRTRVRCSATDTSGNESTAFFHVTMKRTR